MLEVIEFGYLRTCFVKIYKFDQNISERQTYYGETERQNQRQRERHTERQGCIQLQRHSDREIEGKREKKRQGKREDIQRDKEPTCIDRERQIYRDIVQCDFFLSFFFSAIYTHIQRHSSMRL
jgi:hypothetical protein